MINQTYIDDKKVKDILTYISAMRHAEQIRMMFLCSLNGMRSINFCYLQIKDVYNPDLSVKDVICLDQVDVEKTDFQLNDTNHQFERTYPLITNTFFLSHKIKGGIFLTPYSHVFNKIT